MRIAKNARGWFGLLLAAIFAVMSIRAVRAQVTETWTGATDETWAGANWTPAGPPGPLDTALFNGSSSTVNGTTTVDLGTGVTVSNIVFDSSNAAAYTIGNGAVGSQTLTLFKSGAITMNSTVANNELFNAAITLGTDATAQRYTFTNNSLTNFLTFAGNISGGTGGTAGAETLNVNGAGNTFISGSIANGSATSLALFKAGSGTLTLNGSAGSTYTGGTTINGGTLLLDYSNMGAQNDMINPSTSLTMNGGTFEIKGAANNASSQTFSGITAGAGFDLISLTPNTGGTDPNPTLAMGGFTQNAGATVEFVGPSELTSTILSGTGTVGNTAATGAITTTFTNPQANNPAANKGLVWNGNTRVGIATVGLYDWASYFNTTGTAAGGAILGGSQVTGFYTTAASGTIVNGDDNVDITGNVTTAATGGYADTLRFNTNAALTLTIAASKTNTKGFATGGILVTPNVGPNNITIASTGVNAWLAENPSTTNATPIDIYQNNTQGELIITAALFNSGYLSEAMEYVQAGPGTVVMTANGVNNNFTGTNDYLNGGVTEIATDNALGNLTVNTNTGANLNLNGGIVLASTTFALDGGTAAKARTSYLGGNGGGFAAVTGAKLTVDGVIGNSANGTGPLVIGIPASSANGNVAGLVPGTGAGTANTTAVYGNGTVILTGTNTYTGGTTVVGGTLLANAVGATGTGAVNVQSGGTLGGNGTLAPGGVSSGVAVNIAAGGLLQPSASIGTPVTLTLNLNAGTSLNLATGAQLAFVLGTNSDLVNITSGLLSLNNQNFSDFTFTTGSGFTTGTYTLVQTSGDGDITGSLGVNVTGQVGGFNATLVIDPNNQNLDLVVSVPEPSTWTLMIGGFGLLIFGRFRKQGA